MGNTRAIILAAGTGSRLMPMTADRPKSLVPLCGSPMLSRQINIMQNIGLTDITLVGGYKVECLSQYSLPIIVNDLFQSTNMVWSMMCARHLFDGSCDLVVSYGDIVYEADVLECLLQSKSDVAVIADRGWKKLWSLRMENPLEDAETFKVNSSGNILELGKKPKNFDEVQGQYIGLVKYSRNFHKKILSLYDSLDIDKLYDGKPLKQMYMTSFIQSMIDSGICVDAVWINNGWLEVDTIEDLEGYQKLFNENRLNEYCLLD